MVSSHFAVDTALIVVPTISSVDSWVDEAFHASVSVVAVDSVNALKELTVQAVRSTTAVIIPITVLKLAHNVDQETLWGVYGAINSICPPVNPITEAPSSAQRFAASILSRFPHERLPLRSYFWSRVIADRWDHLNVGVPCAPQYDVRMIPCMFRVFTRVT